MNNINGINNISFNQIYGLAGVRDFNAGLEISQDNVSINNQNIKELIDKLILQYLSNFNGVNNICQNGGYSSLSYDELLRLLLLLLQYAKQNGNIGNNLGNEPNFTGSNPISSGGGNFGAPYVPINGSNKEEGKQKGNGAAQGNRATQGNRAAQGKGNGATRGTNNQVNISSNVDLSVYPPEEREKIKRFLERANDAYYNPEKYKNRKGQTSKDGSHWDMLCLGFVATMAGRKDPGLSAKTAKESLEKMRKQGRLRTDWDNMPPGACIYWEGGPCGHIAIYTGEKNEKGEPIVLTSGWPGFSGLRKVPLSEIQRRSSDLGAPVGFVIPIL